MQSLQVSRRIISLCKAVSSKFKKIHQWEGNLQLVLERREENPKVLMRFHLLHQNPLLKFKLKSNPPPPLSLNLYTQNQPPPQNVLPIFQPPISFTSSPTKPPTQELTPTPSITKPSTTSLTENQITFVVFGNQFSTNKGDVAEEETTRKQHWATFFSSPIKKIMSPIVCVTKIISTQVRRCRFVTHS